MKKIIKYILVLLLFVPYSCDITRIDTPTNSSTEEDFFSNNTEFRQSLVSIYGKLYDYYFVEPDGHWSGFVQSLWYLSGDDLTEKNGTRTAEELFDETMNANNYRISWIFDKSYEMILYANIVLEKVATIDYSGYDDPEEIDRMEGEALFLRAYAYYVLFNIYGNVPLITERIKTEEKTNTPVNDKREVLDQVIADASAAIDILPEAWSSEFVGRATKNSARGLLTKALVFRANYYGTNADYTEALAVFNTITANLIPVYMDNFSAYVENNEESLFEIQSSQSTGKDNLRLYNDGPWRGVETMSVYRGMLQKDGVGDGSSYANTKFLITKKLLNNFGSDPRISAFLESNDGYDGLLFQKYTLDGYDYLTYKWEGSANNERVLRYGDLVLIAAEAALKTGNTGTAIGYINQVRTRAREWGLSASLTDGTIPADYSTSETNATTIMQWIMDERFVELACEGQRWWDLKRWHVAGDIDLTSWDGSDQYFSTYLSAPSQFDVNKHLLFPIPQAEIDRNSEITENNPGY